MPCAPRSCFRSGITENREPDAPAEVGAGEPPGRARSIEARGSDRTARGSFRAAGRHDCDGAYIGIAGCFLGADTERFEDACRHSARGKAHLADGHCAYSDAENRLHAEPKPALAHR